MDKAVVIVNAKSRLMEIIGIASTCADGDQPGFLFTDCRTPCYETTIMLRRTFITGITLVIALAMALGVLPVSNTVSTSHDPLALQISEAGQHSALSGIATAEHSHFDDEEVRGDWDPGHNHRHNPADHSHDSPGPALLLYMVARDQAPEWQLSYRFSPYSAPVSRIDRPPRSLFVL